MEFFGKELVSSWRVLMLLRNPRTLILKKIEFGIWCKSEVDSSEHGGSLKPNSAPIMSNMVGEARNRFPAEYVGSTRNLIPDIHSKHKFYIQIDYSY